MRRRGMGIVARLSTANTEAESRAAVTRANTLFTVLVAICVLTGLVLRARGFLYAKPIPLWLDEAQWVRLMLRRSPLEPSIRPLGFLAVTKWLALWFGPSERVLRFLPWLAGVATTLLAVPLANGLFKSRVAKLLLIASITLHPFAIDFAKEFKPYALALAFHVACSLAVIRYSKSGERPWLIASIALASVALLFTQDIVFAYPAIYLVLGARALRGRSLGDKLVWLLGAAVCFCSVLAHYYFDWKLLATGSEPVTEYWGRRYDVFYVPAESHEAHWHWLVRKYLDMAAFPGGRREHWQALGPFGAHGLGTLAHMDRVLWALLHVLGFAVLAYRRRFTELVLFGTPLLVLMVFNALGHWPAGPFRTNLFVLGYTAPLAAFAFESEQPFTIGGVIPTAVLVFLPLLLFERDWHRTKHYAAPACPLWGMIGTLKTLQGADYHGDAEPLVLDPYTCRVWDYYFEANPEHRAQKSELDRRFIQICVQFGHSTRDTLKQMAEQAAGARVWAALSGPESSGFTDGLSLEILDQRNFSNGDALVLSVAEKQRPRRSRHHQNHRD